MSDCHLFHIAYSPETLAHVEPGYEVLNNLNSPHNDWREYWPIRNFLLQQPLNDQDFYGFFSPRFKEKTGLVPHQVRQIVAQAPTDTDLISFSPQADMGAFFINVFEQENTFEPEFIPACETILSAIGISVSLSTLIMDSRQIIFSNYFVARPAFWREWLVITEKIFALGEGPDSPLKALLSYKTKYDFAAERKVFLIERIASLMLTLNPHWKSLATNPYHYAWSAYPFSRFRHEAVISDALKIAMREQGFHQYFEAYSQIRTKLGKPDPT